MDPALQAFLTEAEAAARSDPDPVRRARALGALVDAAVRAGSGHPLPSPTLDGAPPEVAARWSDLAALFPPDVVLDLSRQLLAAGRSGEVARARRAASLYGLLLWAAYSASQPRGARKKKQARPDPTALRMVGLPTRLALTPIHLALPPGVLQQVDAGTLRLNTPIPGASSSSVTATVVDAMQRTVRRAGSEPGS